MYLGGGSLKLYILLLVDVDGPATARSSPTVIITQISSAIRFVDSICTRIPCSCRIGLVCCRQTIIVTQITIHATVI